MASTSVQTGPNSLEEALLWSSLGSIVLNVIGAAILGYLSLTRKFGSESCLGLCGGEGMGLGFGFIVSAGGAIFLSLSAFGTAILVAFTPPVFGLSRRELCLVTAGGTAIAVECAVLALMGDGNWTEAPVFLGKFLLVLSIMLPFPLGSPIGIFVYAVSRVRSDRRLGLVTSLLCIFAAADGAFGIYWWFFSERTM